MALSLWRPNLLKIQANIKDEEYLLGGLYPVKPHTVWIRILRHGESKANAAGIIVSSPNEGLKPQYGLTQTGQQQAEAAGLLLAKELGGDVSGLKIVHSPFSRTVETAQCVITQLNAAAEVPLRMADELRERHFGKYDLTSCLNYRLVWDEDAISTASQPAGGESVDDVVKRLETLLEFLESSYKGQNILLVAHGDVFSILWAHVSGLSLKTHWNIELKNCELRRLPERA